MAKRGCNPTLITLGRTIRIYREQAGLIQKELARKLGYTNAWLSNLETGQLRPRRDQITAIEEALGIPPGVLMSIRAQLDTEDLPGSLRSWTEEEQHAEVVRSYQTTLIPDLLQTPEYAHTLHPGDESTINALLERQAILSRDDPPVFHCVLDEAVLHRDRGAPQVMRDQLLYLVKRVAPPRLTVQILRSADNPYTYPGFTLATTGVEQAGLIPTPVSDIVTNSREDIAALTTAWEATRSFALSQRESIDLIQQIADTIQHADG